ncbi:transglutaminase family protein [Macromonas nakdongensis]|uniref:transglutaminase family protein n=1 Tax=Macromonas nakdongensis TaxID=1843082 RepID=UPI000C32F68B|nr:transglutaminase family protein [Macromonas nakdongensis]
MLLHVRHHTQYRYQSQVVLAQHMAYLRPRDLPSQRLEAHRLHIAPQPMLREDRPDAFGNWRTFFALQSPHDALDVTADSVVLTLAPGELPDSPPWPGVRDRLQYHAQAPYEPASEYVFPSPYIPRHEALADYARPVFGPQRPFLDACQDLMARIHEDFTYETASTDVHTPVLEALAQRKGVCQDFAHLMIGCLRSLGLPARYVSGYLLTQPPPGQPRLIGADASHAWVSVPFDGAWHDFDPTNHRSGTHSPGADYVTLALGRDFGDVSPLRGVIQGGGSHVLKVAVTVAPEAEFSALSAADGITAAAGA